MSKDKIDRTFFCTDELSTQQYLDVCKTIQADHAFATMNEGSKNIKYIVGYAGIQDTRDGSIFNIRIDVRGFGKIRFALVPGEILGVKPTFDKKKETVTNKSMFDSIMDYLGTVEHDPLTHQIFHLRSIDCRYGEYTGRPVVKSDTPLSEMVELYGFNHETVHVGAATCGDEPTAFFFIEESDGHFLLMDNNEDALQRRILFNGKIKTLDDFQRVLHLCEVKLKW